MQKVSGHRGESEMGSGCMLRGKGRGMGEERLKKKTLREEKGERRGHNAKVQKMGRGAKGVREGGR